MYLLYQVKYNKGNVKFTIHKFDKPTEFLSSFDKKMTNQKFWYWASQDVVHDLPTSYVDIKFNMWIKN